MNSQINTFPQAVKNKINFYVYRLVDPRNGETFYVGKGKDNRIFSHINSAQNNLYLNGEDFDETDDKLSRILDIRNSGLDVILIIHRHGMTQDQAFEVEAALIDAYPGTTNIMGGYGSNDRGPMNATQIIDKYSATPIHFEEPDCWIEISVNKSISQANLYDAVRYAWKISPRGRDTKKYPFALAVSQGIIKGVFNINEWLEATPINFPGFPAANKTRWGFVGSVNPAMEQKYVGKLAPPRRRGESAPIRYFCPDGPENNPMNTD